MRRAEWIVLLAAGMLACGASLASVRADDKKEGKVVELDGLKSQAPADWVEGKATGMRYAQFRLPKVKDDSADAEVVVFQGIGGSAQANIERWKTFFIPPTGKTINDVSKVGETKVGDQNAPSVWVCGTYKFKAVPNDPNAKEELRANYCMLGVVFVGKNQTYHIRIVGPEKTVEHHKKGFEDWLKNFK